jgi:hypothetical protein
VALSRTKDVIGVAPEPEEVARARMRRIRKALAVVVAVVIAQCWYMKGVITGEPAEELSPPDCVLVYGGGPQRIVAGLMVAEQMKAKWVVYSAGAEEPVPKPKGGRHKYEVRIVRGAYTTDQNARTTAPVIKELHAKSVILVTSWYHMPRALLVTHLYLLGSGIEVMRVSAEGRPKAWWRERRLWMEIPRMWGTALRVGLAVVGVENWPRPAGYPKPS